MFLRLNWKTKAAYESIPTNDWVVMFCSWKEHAEYARAFYNEGIKAKFEESLSMKERKIQKEHGLTLEQLNWRRHMIDDAFGGDDEKFEVEFPLTDKEAFKSTAKQVFPAKLTDPQRVNIVARKREEKSNSWNGVPHSCPISRAFCESTKNPIRRNDMSSEPTPVNPA